MYAHPIFSKIGDFPQNLKKKIGDKSLAQGFSEIHLIKGSADYFGVNHYTTNIVYRNESVYSFYPSPSFFYDVEVIQYLDSEMDGSSVPKWLKVTHCPRILVIL